ncbi:hypothetical protein MNL02_03060 [Bartonella krasnovii]|uniref:hypothetical protein n=1 Tax=Bartonella krasnovii TaxID=2267275 RepID=UPI001F4C763D|nr:hypothetical protein [Bartonella krasnovii]UNF37776.1 hypothetical protein MNL11_03315 [Bartonella krasnovii]UNF52664.1 hypothetical protein MNL02_03060 [Bartonella krasnovii]
MKKEPAYTIIKYLGGAVNVSRILQKCKGAVYRITYSKEKGGANGLFPSIYQAQLLNYAREHGIDLRPEDFFYPERLQSLMQEQRPPITKICKSPCVDSACDGLQP